MKHPKRITARTFNRLLICMAVAVMAVTCGAVASANNPDTVTLHIYKQWDDDERAGIVCQHLRDGTDDILADADTAIKKVGEAYIFAPKAITGYTYLGLAADSAQETGTVPSGGVLVTMLYEQQPATINVVYKNSVTGAILDQQSYTFPAGAYGPYAPAAVPNHQYVSWDANSDPVSGTIAAGQTKTIVFLYARVYTITYVPNGGVGLIYSDEAVAGSSYTILSDVNLGYSRWGYMFERWSIAPDGSGMPYMNGQSITITDDITLFAFWRLLL